MQSQNDIETNYNALTAKLRENIYFPYLSFLTAIVTISILIIMGEKNLLAHVNFPDYLINLEFKLFISCILGLVFLFDLQTYLKRKQKSKLLFDHYNKQLNAIWESNKKHQKKANTYSDHTEKLKLFISDKLLEYIEYDEKFVHFKGIAAEIRHNGVISYDKVITALEKAIEQQHFLAIYEQNNSETNQPNEHTINSLARYQSAIDAMRYLWDLLDLSTADNMALHIGNRLIECEEHYYQLNLDNQKQLDSTQSIPVSPTFHPQIAALMTLSMLTDEAEIRTLISLSKINPSVLNDEFSLINTHFNIQLSSSPELLGNPNHIILLLENLLKNAQFFSQKNQVKQKTDRVILQLTTQDSYVKYTIYNRGPHIDPRELEQIFKLGYSTRRSKQHHGKGLGLFFCKEIVDGYQGRIQVINIKNTMQSYRLQVNLASDESIIYQLEISEVNEEICVSVVDAMLYQPELIVTTDIPIISVEMYELNSQSEIVNEYMRVIVSNEPVKSDIEWLDPNPRLIANWLIQITPFKKVQQLIFKPLDIKGVQFSVKLPTAESRLNEHELSFEDD